MSVLPFDDRDGTIWYNGALMDWRDAKVHILNHGLHYASSVFEGNRVYDGEIFKLREHSDRLIASGRILGFEMPYSAEEIDKACRDVVAANGIVDGYVRPVAWRGSEMMAIANRGAKVHVAVATWVWPTLFGNDIREKGVRMTVGQWRRPAPDTAPVHAKAAGLYMICTLSKHAAENAGFHDALMLDWRGYVAEATGANIFMVKDGKLHTPIPDAFLDGITRRTVIDLAKARGIEVIERRLVLDEMAGAEEIFLTGTAAEVTPVGCIDDWSYNVGNITRTLMADYDGLVRRKAAA